MKKTIIILIALLNAISLFTACGGGGDNLYEESNYDNVSVYKPEESKTEVENVSSAPLAGEFTVKDKVYDFRGNNIAIVTVKNGTNKDYSVTIKGKYLDKDGNVLKEETQTLDQYSAGYENYFFFEPKMPFEKFTYEIETTEANSPFLAKDLFFRYAGTLERPSTIWSLVGQGDFTKYPTVMADMRFEYHNESEASFWVTMVFFNAEGKIMAICDEVNRYYSPSYAENGEWYPFDLYQTTDKSWKYDGQWEDLTAICIVRGVVPDGDEVWWNILPKRWTPIEGSVE